MVELYQQKFPEQKTTYLLNKVRLVEPAIAFELLNKSYEPLWDTELARALDAAAIRAEKKGEYLASLSQKLKKDPLDFDAATRLFHSYYFAGNTAESAAVLNDFRLLKEKSVRENKSQWNADELWVMAQLHQRALNLNESARFYFALYGALHQNVKAKRYTTLASDDALYGLFQILITAEERPIQIGSGNLDFYKDIAKADASPGVFNGILSLILNGTDPQSEFSLQETKAIGYFNRAQAGAIVRLTQREYPSSKHLPAMYYDVLKIYKKYGMDDLIIKTGEDFFRNFPNSGQLIHVGTEVVEAYARKKDNSNEWRTYDYLLGVASKRNAQQLFAPPQQPSESYEEEEEEEYENESTPQPVQSLEYESLLKRYIASLTREKNFMGVLRLYRDQLQQHPSEEMLYIDFAAYLAQNNLFDEESGVYKEAIKQFKTRSWYEKLARWYIRREQQGEFEKISREIVDLFAGTEVAEYINSVHYPQPYRSLQIAINEYALSRFPYNLTFVNNLLEAYVTNGSERPPVWHELCRKYYFLDESIRQQYNFFNYRANGTSRDIANPTTNPEKLFAADILVWNSHYSEAVPLYEDLAAKYSSDRWLNVRVADLKRSLAWQNPSFYAESASIREHLARISPSDIALWTTAGETLAEIEEYTEAKENWENIIRSDPQNPERYLEVATILWDYYLFDDALNLIQRARSIQASESLYAYEAGAIYESKRNYEAAVAEYSKSLIAQSEEARNRLTELYKRPRLAALIRTHLDTQLKQNPQDSTWWAGVIEFYSTQQEKHTVMQYLTRAIETLQPKSFAEISSSLANTARRFGFNSANVMIIQKQIQYASSDLERITLNLELARFYDSRGEKQAAESILVALYKKQPSSHGLIQDLILFYWRNGHYDKAFAIYDSALSIANSQFRKRFLREVAGRYRERKLYDRALTSVAELRKDDPLNADLFQFVSEIYAEQGNYKSMVEHYRAGLQLVRDSKLSEDQKKQQIASMRRGIIQANLILKDYTAALDQYIELLNRDAENESLVRESAEFAARYALTPRLIEYYQKTAAASPKDHRWPMMLGRIYLDSGNPADAITSFRAAIAIRPERVDLNESLADAHRRAGQYKEAIQTYEQLYALTYKDTNWLGSMAELEARLGNQKKALELYERYIEPRSLLQRQFMMSAKALSWGMPASAVAYGNAGMKEFRADLTQSIPSEGFAAYMEAMIQTNSAPAALEIMVQTLNRLDKARVKATFADEALRSNQYMIQDTLIRTFPLSVRKYLTGTEIEKLETALLTHAATYKTQLKRERLLPLAHAAGMARAEEQLLQGLLANSYDRTLGNYRSDRQQLQRFYLDRHAYAACGKFLETEWKRRKSNYYHDYDLVEAAYAYRLAQMTDKELVVLREYFNIAVVNHQNPTPEAIERYLTLLYERNLRNELRSAATKANFTVANFFVKKKDQECALIAIESLAKTKEPVWKTIQSAMLAKELNINEPFVRELFSNGLDLRSIADQLETRADSALAVSGDDWFFYGTRYGEYLWNTGNRSEATYYLLSDIEGAPVRGEYQDELGTYYLTDMPESALHHFNLATELEPGNIYYADHRAEALVALGKKEEAIAIWKSLITPPSSERYLLILRAASKHTFLDSVHGDIESFLSGDIQKNGALQIALITEYLPELPNEKRQAVISKWISSAPAPKEFSAAILRIRKLEPADRIAILKQTAAYLKTWMRSSSGQEIELARNQWASWNLKAAKEYLEMTEVNLAESITSEVLEELKTTESENQYFDEFILLHAKTLLRLNKTSEAVELLQKFARGSYSKQQDDENVSLNEEKYRQAAELLQEEQKKTEANLILEELYEQQLTSGSTDSSLYIGLAEIRLDQNKVDDALHLLKRMIYGLSEDPERFNLAANVLEKHDRLEDAIQFREELLKRKPWDSTNQAALSEDYVELKKNKEAALEAKRILELNIATLEDKIRAAKVYGKASKLLAGSPEMQEIEKVVRNQKVTSYTNIHYTALREVLLEQNQNQNLKLLLSELYVNPASTMLKVPLFRAYKNAGLCENALIALDPENVSEENYVETEEDSGGYGDEYYGEYDRYDRTQNYPIKNLNLSDQESLQLALEASDCAEKIRNYTRQIFFLHLAMNIETDMNKKQRIQEKITQVEKTAAEAALEETGRWKVGPNLGRES